MTSLSLLCVHGLDCEDIVMHTKNMLSLLQSPWQLQRLSLHYFDHVELSFQGLRSLSGLEVGDVKGGHALIHDVSHCTQIT